ncbi:hypothetical protein [Parafilimonas terrae]|uniref:Uncharacterized protein n=1 Tax=Parafilimonas terrae TaxID=1465490 RepID=A0A1I5SD65_9BACT|nr:hypothetical protein [Parafilimonas terrae]SFP68718.1 hypothetical protein SAMN05444277_101711 [Parafilimonas terrae]
MNNWKLAYKITAVNCGIVVLIGIVCGAVNYRDNFGLILGLVCLFGGVINLVLGIFIILLGSKDWGKGFLNSAGILLLLSGISCSIGFSDFNLH